MQQDIRQMSIQDPLYFHSHCFHCGQKQNTEKATEKDVKAFSSYINSGAKNDVVILKGYSEKNNEVI